MQVDPSEAIQSLTGLICWAVYVGEGIGGLTMRFGQRIPKGGVAPVADDPAKYTGQFNLWVTTSWRVEWRGQVVGTSNDPNDESSWIDELTGKHVVSVEVFPPAWDLILKFDDGFRLHVFANRSEWEEDPTAWQVYTPDGPLMIVGPSGQWTIDDDQPMELMWKRRQGRQPRLSAQ